ncbi:MAG TPA: sodium:solute symporter [Ktedonobacteraceae bacterium]|jgi:SSS family solute:Na+ symporter|nr:sodium:solute symporter [Ktedonobacteraceae bacterium]
MFALSSLASGPFPFSPVAFTVFIIFFLLVTVLGFIAARWRRGNLDLIHEWGLAGRRFGTLVTWFLLGGDLYTAYTFIAVPAAMFGLGALNGWFAVPYTVLVYPIIYVLMPKFWSVCKQRGYVTAADFVQDRFGSQTLAFVVALTGIVATLPYIALQMFGIQVSLAALGVPLAFSIGGFSIDLPLLIAFLILAAYTYTSGLRAPAMIALVKDVMIFIVLFAVLIVLPAKLGGFGAIFNAVAHKAATHPATIPGPGGKPVANPNAFFEFLKPTQYWAYVTLALGSALALFLYPHSLTSVLSSNSKNVVKRNTALLPIYSLMLGLLALTGYMAIAAGINPPKSLSSNYAVPLLINAQFPDWFAGFAFAAISIGALVPAAVMSIAAANLFTRNIYKAYIRREAGDREESSVAKWASFVLKFGAVLFIVYIPTAQVINFQLLGGIWILQTLPAVFLGLYTSWFNRWALVIGWLVAEVLGTILFIAAGLKSVYAISIFGLSLPSMYIAFSMVILNLLLAVILTPIFNAISGRSQDVTAPTDYDVEEAEPVEVGKEALG